MTTAPTPEQFLTQPSTDEEDFEEVMLLGIDPLISIAESLRTLVALTEGHDTEEKASDRLREAYDDLDAKAGVMFDLIEAIEAIIKPSTSKLANSVREAINRWRNPEVSVEVPAAEPVAVPGDYEPATEPSVPVADAPRCGACTRYFVDQELLDRHVCTAVPVGAQAQGLEQPANDAPVAVWRQYARDLGHEVSDQVNRSQIRTLLGLPHVEA